MDFCILFENMAVIDVVLPEYLGEYATEKYWDEQSNCIRLPGKVWRMCKPSIRQVRSLADKGYQAKWAMNVPSASPYHAYNAYRFLREAYLTRVIHEMEVSHKEGFPAKHVVLNLIEEQNIDIKAETIIKRWQRKFRGVK